jgi:quinol monooxygenase YgiN
MRPTLCALILVAFLCPAAALALDEHPIAQMVKGKVKDPAKPFVMGIRVKIKADMREKFEQAFTTAQKETRKEKGCLAYDLNRSTDDEALYVIYERWANLDALKAHLKSPHITKLFETAHDCFDGDPDVRVYLPVGE